MEHERDTFAQAGDILLSRTGNRVSWNPVMVVSGKAPITDHVFRIRLNESDREIALKSFRNPRFQQWLNAVCKGVCATVLTKQDLLKMPLFSMAS
jgi:type I restriction enzyme M protein